MSFAFSQPSELTPSATQFHFAVKRRIGTPTFMCRDLTYALMIQAIRVGHGLQRFSVEDLPHYFFVVPGLLFDYLHRREYWSLPLSKEL